jgi:molybdopterin/thiamine biosynthesis adenylyltransferase
MEDASQERKKLDWKEQFQGERDWNEVYRRISWWDTKRVAESTVMVVGAGALGNEVLKNLALLNVGRILIVDFDHIEYSNLSRSVLYRENDALLKQPKSYIAAERIREMNPHVKVMAINGDILLDVGLGIFRRMDVVVGCLDNRVARLYVNRHCFKLSKTWIDGALENMHGQMSVYRRDVSCYECQLSDMEQRFIQQRLSCPDVAIRNSNVGRIPTTPISASVIGALQAQEALKVIFNNEKQTMLGKRFEFEGMNNDFLLYESAYLNDDCHSHSLIDEVIEGPELSCHMPVKGLLSWLEKRFPGQNPKVFLDFEIVLKVVGKESQVEKDLIIPHPHFSEERARPYQTTPGEDLIITESVRYIDRQFPAPDMTLQELGTPALHILTIETDEGMFFVELTGDESFLAYT